MAGFTTRPVVMVTLERGGSAIDAGVAAVFALTLLKPYECGIRDRGFDAIPGRGPHDAHPLEVVVEERLAGRCAMR